MKNVGRGAAQAIIAAREEKGAFISLEDLCNKVDLHEVNRKVLEALIKCGAFDTCAGLLGGRNGMLEELERPDVRRPASAARGGSRPGHHV